MLHEILTSNRIELISRCRKKAAKRFNPSELPPLTDHGVPLFLEQLVETLRQEESGPQRPEDPMAPSEISRAAALHGAELLRMGYSVDQVVHDYGDVCQAVTELAAEQKKPIATDEFRVLNRCLDNAIAGAVRAFGHARQAAIADQSGDLQKRLESHLAEQRRLADIAIQAYAAIRTGNIGLAGATGALLIHSLEELRALADRALPDPAAAKPQLAAVSA